MKWMRRPHVTKWFAVALFFVLLAVAALAAWPTSEAPDVVALSFSSDGRFLAAGTSWQELKLWDISGARPRRLPLHIDDELRRRLHLEHLRFCGPTTIAATAQSTEDASRSEIIVWDVVGNALVRSVPLAAMPRQFNVASQTGLAVTCANAGQFHLWDLNTGKPFRSLTDAKWPAEEWLDFDLSDDGRRLAVCFPGRKGTTTLVWNLESQERPIELVLGSRERPSSVTLSPDGSLIAVEHAYGIDIWNVDKGGPMRDMVLDRPFDAAFPFSPDGTSLVVPSGAKFVVHSTSERGDRGEFAVPRRGYRHRDSSVPPQVAYSPDGNFIAASSADVIALFNADKHRRIVELTGARRAILYWVFAMGLIGCAVTWGYCARGQGFGSQARIAEVASTSTTAERTSPSQRAAETAPRSPEPRISAAARILLAFCGVVATLWALFILFGDHGQLERSFIVRVGSLSELTIVLSICVALASAAVGAYSLVEAIGRNPVRLRVPAMVGGTSFLTGNFPTAVGTIIVMIPLWILHRGRTGRAARRLLAPGCWGWSFLCASVLLSVGVLLMSAIGAAREAAHRLSCHSNLYQIAYALRSYHDQFQCYPPAYGLDDDGNRMHSWRVLLTNDQGWLGSYYGYNREFIRLPEYRFNEPWSGDNNIRLLNALSSDMFACPNDTNAESSRQTSYVAVVGPNTLWPGAESFSWTELGLAVSDKILLIEIPSSEFPWLEPRDLEFDEAIALFPKLIETPHRRRRSHGPDRGLQYVTVAGDVRDIRSIRDVEHFKQLLTINRKTERTDPLIAPLNPSL